MNLTQHRADLAQVLTEATQGTKVTVHRYVPESVSAPAVVIEPGDPYLSSEQAETPFGQYHARWDLIAVAQVATNETATDELDDLIGAIVAGLAGAYVVERVSQPYVYQSNTALHLAADLTVTDLTNLTTE